MAASLFRLLFLSISYLCFVVYGLRAYTYCESILTPVLGRKGGSFVSLAVNILAFSLTLFCALPAVLNLSILYLMVVLQCLYLFRGGLTAVIFVSGMFLFHIMNVKMAVTSVFVLLYDVPSYAGFRESGLSLLCTLVILLLLLLSLELFQKIIDLPMLQTLMKTPGQLRFVTISMMFINVYLLILSVSYSGQAYSGVAGIFLLSTALLLFGAFYTSFWHGIKMSVLLENEHRAQRLQELLQSTREDVEELQAFAFLDTLTAVHNRRYGLGELEKLLQEHTPFCLCFLDIDHLKYVNDTFGHEEGDRYILDVVKVLSGSCTPGEILSRMGGDEFMLLLPRVPQAAALERVRQITEEVSRIPSVYHPGVSCGIVEVKADAGWSAAQVLRYADQKMYRHKQDKESEDGGQKLL